MFFDGSRYLTTPDIDVRDADGALRKIKRPRELKALVIALTYQVREGDRLDLLAHKFYRDPRKWWLIADANPDVLAPDQLLTPGQLIAIPKDLTV